MLDLELRLKELMLMEKELCSKGYGCIAGVDEAGRGPLAGPVVAAACVLPPDLKIYGLDDSKKVAPKKRLELFQSIKEQATAYSVGIATSEEVDSINILAAAKLAMKRALDALPQQPDYILIDGRDGLNIPIQNKAVIGGDGLVACIAAASILAKVTRDEIMCRLHEIYPVYGFDKHKGYATRWHLDAIAKYGPCPIHRRSFSPVKDLFTNGKDNVS